jgi:hypothetical protein
MKRLPVNRHDTLQALLGGKGSLPDSMVSELRGRTAQAARGIDAWRFRFTVGVGGVYVLSGGLCVSLVSFAYLFSLDMAVIAIILSAIFCAVLAATLLFKVCERRAIAQERYWRNSLCQAIYAKGPTS